MNTDSLIAENPLLDFSSLPRFDRVRPEHVVPAMDQLISRVKTALESVVNDSAEASWDTVVSPLEIPLEQLGRAWSCVGHLQAVVDSPELRAAFNASLPKVVDFYSHLGSDLRLFARYKALILEPSFSFLSEARQRVVKNALRDFRLGGAELTGSSHKRFLDISARLAELTQKFSENVLDVTNAWTHYASDLQTLKGLPDENLAAAKQAAEKEGKQGYKLTLQAPSYFPAMQYLESRALREILYRAYVTRASELGEARFDNSPLMVEILQLRAEQAALLGFKNYAELSVATKMVNTPTEAIEFVRSMATRAKPFATEDMEQLREFAKTALGIEDLCAWDVPYASEKLRQARYSYSDNEVKQYFTETRVLAGLFELIQTLFNVSIETASAPLWHADARFYTLKRSGHELAHLYLDSYARSHKRSGAWMDVSRPRRLTATGVQTPVAYVTCNFASPVNAMPALLTHQDVITLFHEFGHALHHVLTQVDEPGVDMRAVEWDAIELPSQFMENFCWEWDVIEKISSHIQTGATLPRDLFEKMLTAKNFQSGMFTERQMEFALFDLLLHTDTVNIVTKTRPIGAIEQLLRSIRQEVSVVPVPDYNRFQHAFEHIFGGGYAAGYYSYQWAEVLSADAYSLFEEQGPLNPKIGEQFLQEILEVGAARPIKESFRAFRGRDPQIEALLRHNGMLKMAA